MASEIHQERGQIATVCYESIKYFIRAYGVTLFCQMCACAYMDDNEKVFGEKKNMTLSLNKN
ncbi:hypothetical protein H5410_028831 [Solanum commersonii]|uniref:Uncharacterized protein n=1 Tax=Solanum commersonii TaxID=4109 RepID=A0A9J5Z320_SOLCO|nr:hypothetical protein H5410_028831 [Solanum commersonii]